MNLWLQQFGVKLLRLVDPTNIWGYFTIYEIIEKLLNEHIRANKILLVKHILRSAAVQGDYNKLYIEY